MYVLRFGGDFVCNRLRLIDCLEKGKLTKREFIEESYRLCSCNRPVSAENCKTFSDALYRYEYYNIMAKYHLIKRSSMAKGKKNHSKIISIDNKIGNFYREKDRAILLMLFFSKDSEVSAYYVNTVSDRLSGVLYEIDFHAKERVILHSKSEAIKETLISRGLFSHERRESLISDYINSAY